MIDMVNFRDRPLKERKDAVQAIFKKYPDRIPVCVYKNKGTNIPDLDKEKFLVPSDLSIGQFVYVIRKRIKLTPEQALYIFFNEEMVNTSISIKEVYQKYKNNDDDMLYAMYGTENTFGYI